MILTRSAAISSKLMSLKHAHCHLLQRVNGRTGNAIVPLLSQVGSSAQQGRHAQETSSRRSGLADHHSSEETAMTTEVQCLQYARECAGRAKLVSNPELRERLLNIARNWTDRATREPSDAKARANEPREGSAK
jgi:hypothetical protein